MSRDPALVYEADPMATPGTHVLLVGVGHYEHLKDGSGQLFTETLGQLDSPPASARSLADWFLAEYDNPEKPLASLSMVVSTVEPFVYERPGDGVATTVPQGSGLEIESALRRWAARAAADPENLCVFFFCGHGVEDGRRDPQLLARDFGGDPLAYQDGVIDAVSIRAMMRLTGPAQQLYLWDCCRVRDTKIIDDAGMGRRPLSTGPKPGGGANSVQATILAADAGTRAYGRPHAPSVFVGGLLTALRTAGHQSDDDHWWVSALDVRKQIDARTSHIQRGAFDGADIVICKLAGEPEVPVFLRCTPTEIIQESRLRCTKVDGTHCNGHDGMSRLENDLWEFQVAQDEYVFEAAALAHGAYPTVSTKRRVYPPQANICLKTNTGSGG